MTRASLAGRIAAIEAARRLAVTGSGALSKDERIELDQLLAAARPDINTMTGEDADAWLHAHSIDGSDPAVEQRIAELRERQDLTERSRWRRPRA